MAFHPGPNLARTWCYKPASPAAEPLLHAGLSWSRAPPREPLAGTTVHTPPGTPGHFQARFPQVTYMSRRCELGRFPALFRLTSEKSLVRTQLRPLTWPYARQREWSTLGQRSNDLVTSQELHDRLL